MSTAVEAPTAAATGWRRHRSTLLIVGALVAALALVIVTQGTVTRGAELDPDNPGPDGAQALARVLADQGVDVEVVRTADDFDRADLGPAGLVVVTSSDDLGASTAQRLLDRVSAARAGLVVVDPTSALLAELGIDGDPTRIDVGDGVRGDCADATYDDLDLVTDGADAVPLPGCFADALADTETSAGSGLTLLGAGQLLTNDQILRGDNAAIALRLLGSTDRLVWYVASDSDQVADDGVSISSLLPDWIAPGLAIALFSSLLLVLWRGRRLGPLASEPLPVIVKAIETTRSRGRLYRKSGDRGHAADALRAATRTRVATRLRRGPTADDAALVRDVARHVGRPESEITDLIGSAAAQPRTDRDLIVLANALAALEEEVRRT
jgi:hypothetical protein